MEKFISQLDVLLSSDDILDRLKIALHLSRDKELADWFQVGPNMISLWRKRNSLDYTKLFKICIKCDISISWIILARSPIWLEGSGLNINPDSISREDIKNAVISTAQNQIKVLSELIDKINKKKDSDNLVSDND